MTKYIAIASGKRGVGKTTVAANLAIALHKLGRDITLIDANLTTPHLNFHLNFPTPKTTLSSILKEGKHISEALYLHPSGLKIVPGSTYLGNHNKELSAALLDLFGKTEIAIMDSAPGFDETALKALRSADETIIVVNPEITAINDAIKTINIAEEHSNVIGVVLNKLKSNKNQIIKIVQQRLNRPVIAAIAEDRNIPKSLSLGRPILCSYPNSQTSKEFRQLADLLNL